MTIRTKIATFGIIAALAGGMVGTSAPIASAAPVAAPTATSYFRAGATVNFPTTWTAGQPLTVTGQGFRTRSGRSVTVVLRGDEGEIYHEVRPDANGKFTTSIPWSNSLQAGQSIEFETFALTRGGFYEGSEVDVRVVAAPARQNPAPQPKTTTGAARRRKIRLVKIRTAGALTAAALLGIRIIRTVTAALVTIRTRAAAAATITPAAIIIMLAVPKAAAAATHQPPHRVGSRIVTGPLAAL